MLAKTWEPGFQGHSLDFVRALGRGAFGEVALVKSAALPETGGVVGQSRLLALKRVPVTRLSKAGTDKALAEAVLLQKLGAESDRILRCFDFRITPGTSPSLELLLEFAPLGDLSRRIRSRKESQPPDEGLGLQEAEVVSYARDVAAGLAHIHAMRPKIIHRDVKPANIVLFNSSASEGGLGIPRAKIADFGVAKVLESEGKFAGAGTVIGTPFYFAPEICRGEKYDDRADAWSLGCVIYEMICLHRPFHENNLALLAARISEGRWDKKSLERRASAYNDLLIMTLKELLATRPSGRRRARDALHLLNLIWGEVRGGVAGMTFDDWKPLATSPQLTDEEGSAAEHEVTQGEETILPPGTPLTALPSPSGSLAGTCQFTKGAGGGPGDPALLKTELLTTGFVMGTDEASRHAWAHEAGDEHLRTPSPARSDDEEGAQEEEPLRKSRVFLQTWNDMSELSGAEDPAPTAEVMDPAVVFCFSPAHEPPPTLVLSGPDTCSDGVGVADLPDGWLEVAWSDLGGS
mmetsp:Transcript_30221/g.85224  ORF Transcript_30221/g.85224 Transcript_30221/m.85224 type:complete len:520 (+) Transcript_30221:69-1628(+)